MIIKNRFGTYSSHINAVSPDTSTFWWFLGWYCSVDVQDRVKLGLCSIRCCYLSFKQGEFILQRSTALRQNLVGLQQFDEIRGWDQLWYWLYLNIWYDKWEKMVKSKFLQCLKIPYWPIPSSSSLRSFAGTCSTMIIFIWLVSYLGILSLNPSFSRCSKHFLEVPKATITLTHFHKLVFLWSFLPPSHLLRHHH